MNPMLSCTSLSDSDKPKQSLSSAMKKVLDKCEKQIIWMLHIYELMQWLLHLERLEKSLFISVDYWTNVQMAPINSHIWILSHQGVTLFGKIRRVNRCGLVEVSVALLEEVCQWRWDLSFLKPIPDLFSLFSIVCVWGCRTLSYFFCTTFACVLLCSLPWWERTNIWNFNQAPN